MVDGDVSPCSTFFLDHSCFQGCIQKSQVDYILVPHAYHASIALFILGVHVVSIVAISRHDLISLANQSAIFFSFQSAVGFFFLLVSTIHPLSNLGNQDMLWRSLHATPVFYMKNDLRFGSRQSWPFCQIASFKGLHQRCNWCMRF